jgi:hypothetical protein
VPNPNLPVDAHNYGSMNPDQQPTYPAVAPDNLTINKSLVTIGDNNRMLAIDQTSVYIMAKFAALPDTAKAIQALPGSAMAQFVIVPTGQPALPLYYPFPQVPIAAGTSGPPVVLDGWGNPILFVPASGLFDVYTNLIFTNSSNGYTGSVIPIATPITSPDNRPFWVSAGPDGDFCKGDDNIYSFNPQ